MSVMIGSRPREARQRDGERVGDLVLSVRDLTVAYGDVPILRSIDLDVAPGETVALLGPSGSGKTTLLYAIAGFLPLTAGTIHLEGRLAASPSDALPPEQRTVGMVFQHYGLWPHLDARETVAYPLRRARVPSAEADREALALLEQLGVGHLARRKPAELSGGEQQRVGVARALARHPALYLLDEPTAHLDTALKRELQAELRTRMRADGAAALHATHDVDEALAVADRVALLRDGRIVQVGNPVEVYARPVDAWVARLTGPASFVGAEGGGTAEGGGRAEGGGAAEGISATEGMSTAEDLVRPDWVAFEGPIPATVVGVLYRGTHTDYRLDTPEGPLLLREPGPPRRGVGERTSCRIERRWRIPGAR